MAQKYAISSAASRHILKQVRLRDLHCSAMACWRKIEPIHAKEIGRV
jgi:hypothetical protein